MAAQLFANIMTQSSDIRYRVYNHEGIFVGVYSYLDETGEFKPVKIFME